MFVIKKNQVVISALVVLIAAAGYINYIDSGRTEPNEVMMTDEGDLTGIIPDDFESADADDTAFDDNNAIAASTSDDEEIAAEDGQSTAGEAVFVNTSSDSSYFVQAKLDREQARAKEKDILTDMLNNDNVEQAKKSECADAMLNIQQRIEKETAAEAMIEAKGFKEVYVRIDDGTVDVVVNKEELTPAEIAQIEDIVKRKTGIAIENIRISPIKK
jgi:stage III sporulation protein AH